MSTDTRSPVEVAVGLMWETVEHQLGEVMEDACADTWPAGRWAWLRHSPDDLGARAHREATRRQVMAGLLLAVERRVCVATRHGTVSAYTKSGCRCRDAREATRLYAKRCRLGLREPARVDSAGTARRLKALAAVGWGLTALAARLEATKARVAELRRGRNPSVHRSTATRVADLYDELCMTPGSSLRAVTHARRQGWPPPLAWGEDIDNPAATPCVGADPARRLDPAEVLHLAGGGCHVGEIARRLGVTEYYVRQVLRRGQAGAVA